jgi:hypothetical protein
MDKVQKPSSNECYTPSSDPFRMYLFLSSTVETQYGAKFSTVWSTHLAKDTRTTS